MKAMILTDFLTMKKLLVQTGVIWVVLMLALMIVVSPMPIFILYAGPIEAFMIVQGLMLDEEKGAWAGSRLTLPISRSQVIAGRYVSLAITAVAATVLVALVYVLVCALGFAFPGVGEIARFPLAFDAPTFMLSIGASIMVALIILGLLLPFFARFESVNGMRYALVAISLLFMLGLMMGMNPSSGLFAQGGVLALASGPGAIALLAAALVVMGGAFYVASATIAMRLYNKREF